MALEGDFNWINKSKEKEELLLMVDYILHVFADLFGMVAGDDN